MTELHNTTQHNRNPLGIRHHISHHRVSSLEMHSRNAGCIKIDLEPLANWIWVLTFATTKSLYKKVEEEEEEEEEEDPLFVWGEKKSD